MSWFPTSRVGWHVHERTASEAADIVFGSEQLGTTALLHLLQRHMQAVTTGTHLMEVHSVTAVTSLSGALRAVREGGTSTGQLICFEGPVGWHWEGNHGTRHGLGTGRQMGRGKQFQAVGSRKGAQETGAGGRQWAAAKERKKQGQEVCVHAFCTSLTRALEHESREAKQGSEGGPCRHSMGRMLRKEGRARWHGMNVVSRATFHSDGADACNHATCNRLCLFAMVVRM